MGDTLIRHAVAICLTALCGVAYYSGYISGPHQWWWTAFGLIIIYGAAFNFVNK
ncbi:MAG: hypothetical protein WCT40_02345 [Candidatus Magasanikbacteria bacterium]